MIPTFLAISLIVFAIVNFAPGKPGGRQIGAQGGQQSNTGEQRESYRIFKEQFNLDKPVLINLRYRLTTKEVQEVMLKVLNEEDSTGKRPYPIGEQIESQEYLENLGRYAVPGLMEVLNNHPSLSMRALASQRLTINARRRMEGEFRKDLSSTQKAVNKAISEETERFRKEFFMVPSGEGEADKGDLKTEKDVKEIPGYFATMLV